MIKRLAFLPILFLTSSNIALAQAEELDADDIISILDGLAQFAITIAVSILVIFIVYYGIKMVTAGGNADKFQDAKKGLIWSLVGALVVLGVGVIINTIANLVSGNV